MNHRQILEDTVSGHKPARTPVALWRHFPVDDQDPASLTSATLDFQKTYDFDLVKVTPASSFCTRDWGAGDVWRGAPEGTREYNVYPIRHADDWTHLPLLDPQRGYLGAQLECIKMITAELGDTTPVLQTVFSPLAQAKNLVSRELLLVHMRRHPQAVHAGLAIIAESTRRFVEEVMKTGVAGVFFAVQHAQYQLLSEDEFRTFGRPYDLLAIEPAGDAWLNMIHLHGENVMFDAVVDYPATIINWHDRDTWPNLAEGQQRFGGTVCGGLRRETSMVLGNPASIIDEAQDAIRSTGGRRFILGTGCVTPITAPRSNLLAARKAVESFSE